MAGVAGGDIPIEEGETIVVESIGVSTDPRYMEQFGSPSKRVPITLEKINKEGKNATVQDLAKAARHHYQIPKTKKVHCWFYPPNYDDSKPFSSLEGILKKDARPKRYTTGTELPPGMLVFCNVVEADAPARTPASRLVHLFKFNNGRNPSLSVMSPPLECATALGRFIGDKASEENFPYAKDGLQLKMTVSPDDVREAHQIIFASDAYAFGPLILELRRIQGERSPRTGPSASEDATKEDLSQLSVKELKLRIQEFGLSTTDCFEKGDLVEKLRGAEKSNAGKKKTTTTAGGGEGDGGAAAATGSWAPMFTKPQRGSDVFRKPSTSLGWFLGPDTVCYVYGPWIPVTEGILLSLMCQGFGRDVHVLNGLAGMINDSREMNTVSKKFQQGDAEVAEGWARHMWWLNFLSTPSSKPPMALSYALLSARRLFSAGYVSHTAIDALFAMAIDDTTFLGELPLELVTTLTTALYASTNENSMVQAITSPDPSLLERVFNDIAKTPVMASSSQKSNLGWKYGKTAARLQLLSALLEQVMTPRTPMALLQQFFEVVTETRLASIVSLVGHSHTIVAEAALRVCGSFTNSTDAVLDLLLKCGFLPVLRDVLGRPGSDPGILKEALWAAHNIFAGSPSQQAAALKVNLDMAGLRYLSDLASAPNPSKPPAFFSEAVFIAATLVAHPPLLREESVFKLAQDIGHLLKEDWTTKQSHHKNLFAMVWSFCSYLDKTLRPASPKLVQDVLRWWSGDPLIVAALGKHRTKYQKDPCLPRIEEFFNANDVAVPEPEESEKN